MNTASVLRLTALSLLWLQAQLAIAESQSWQFDSSAYLAQGYLNSNGNQYYGDSRDGSFEYHEAAVNAYASYGETFRLAGQVFTRDAGANDNDEPRIDYLFFDWGKKQLDRDIGLRIGRVKNHLGLYNDVSDVIFTRPSILMPYSVYLQGNGLRDILFSSDGAQFYFRQNQGQTAHHLILSAGRSRDLNDKTSSNIFGTGNLPGQNRLHNPRFFQYKNISDYGRRIFGLSYFETRLQFHSDGTLPADPELNSQLTVLSAQRHYERLSLSAELSHNRLLASFGSVSGELVRQGGYLQAEYRWNSQWNGLLRTDVAFDDRNNRSKTRNRDFTVGLRWTPDNHWLWAAEWHWIDGSSAIPRRDNPMGIGEHTRVLALMGAYRF